MYVYHLHWSLPRDFPKILTLPSSVIFFAKITAFLTLKVQIDHVKLLSRRCRFEMGSMHPDGRDGCVGTSCKAGC